jgi:uncharacterized protein (TIGR03382 family)
VNTGTGVLAGASTSTVFSNQGIAAFGSTGNPISSYNTGNNLVTSLVGDTVKLTADPTTGLLMLGGALLGLGRRRRSSAKN